MHRLRIVAAAGLLIWLAACATQTGPLPTDTVRDEATAIAAGRKACSERGGGTGEGWTASFSAGQWTVERLYHSGHTSCDWERVTIWADNGKAKPCEICVMTT